MSDFHGAERVYSKQCTANPGNRRPAVLCERDADWYLPCVPVGYFCEPHAVAVAEDHRRKGCKAGAQ